MSPPRNQSLGAKMPRSMIEPVNKVNEGDKDKSEACHDLVKRMRLEKK